MLRLKCLFIIFFFSNTLFSNEVVVTNAKIKYKEIIDVSKLSISNVQKIKKYCVPMKLDDFKNEKYIAKKYLRIGKVICAKDVEKYQKRSVLFNFGSIQIEKPGKVIFENDEYIKIKKLDGKIEKIYKNGRVE